MKRKNYITISVDDLEFAEIEKRAEQEQRAKANIIYLLLQKALKEGER